MSDQSITDILNCVDDPAAFSDGLRMAAKESKLSLVLTKLLSRDDLDASKKPVEMISRLCNLAEETGLARGSAHHIQVADDSLELIGLQVSAEVDSGERLARFTSGIDGSNGVFMPIQIAEWEDQKVHHRSNPVSSGQPDPGSHLNRSDVEKLNKQVAERLEDAVRSGRLQISTMWEACLRWYLNFAPVPAHSFRETLLADAHAVVVLLSVIIREQAVTDFESGQTLFADVSKFLIERALGLDLFARALIDHEPVLKKHDSARRRLVLVNALQKSWATQPSPPEGPSPQ
ncbi:MAG: hypothetical protein U1G07_17775 [Verrucomicrobiota bacterium]